MSTPFDIPITQPSGGGSLPFASVVTQDNTVYTDIPENATGVLLANFEVLITPTSATQKVNLSGVINGEWSMLPLVASIVIYRNGTALAPTSGGTNNQKVNGQFLINLGVFNHYSQSIETCPFAYTDEPATTSEIKYEIYLVTAMEGDFHFNRCISASNNLHHKRMTSSFSAQCFEP